MEIGIISDTHGYLDPCTFRAFADCDEIWHAGDFGGIEIADQLSEFKPLRGVYGNIDDSAVRLKYPEDLRFQCEGVDVWMTHIAGRPNRYPKRIRQKLTEKAPQVLVCGHSHILAVENDKRFAGMKYINPGAAGHQGFHLMRTLLKAQFVGGQIRNLRLIELGPRGRRIQGQIGE